MAKQQDEAYNNQTGTDLEILQRIEQAWKRNNPSAQKRNTARSLDWFSKYVRRAYNKVGTGVMFRDRSLWKSKFTIGKMYFFEYSAKHAETLEIWDRMPLIFPFGSYVAKDGMTIVTAINLHYLPPALRRVAFSSLLKLRTEKRYRKQTRLELEWAALKAMSNHKLFEHAVHAYRMDHIRSTLVEVPAQSWELALFLPTERWAKGSNKTAWKLKK